MSTLHVRVAGMVQGVGFRWYVRERARRLGVSGWVRNLADGSVEVFADGGPDALTVLRAELVRGPRGARVDTVVDESATPPEEVRAPFEILR